MLNFLKIFKNNNNNNNNVEIIKDKEEFDNFINKVLINYLNESNILNRYGTIYERIQNLSSERDIKSILEEECSNLYILTKTMYEKLIQKIINPIDFKWKNTKGNNDNFYVMDIKSLTNNRFVKMNRKTHL